MLQVVLLLLLLFIYYYYSLFCHVACEILVFCPEIESR